MSSRIVILVLGAFCAFGCGQRTPPHTPEHYLCRRECVAVHDRCIVAARDGEQLQSCDRSLSPCLVSCPY